jgi:hypothetical protein
MYKLLIFFLPLIIFANTKNIDTKISLNKIILKTKQKQKTSTQNKIKDLVTSIQSEENIYNDIEYNLNKVSNNILLNKLKLKKAKKNIKILDEKTIQLKANMTKLEEKIVNLITERYSITLSKNLIDKQSLQGIIQKEKYNLILNNTKDTILKSNLNYFKLSNDKRKNTKKRKELEVFIYDQEKEKIRFKKLKQQQQQSLVKLKLKHQQYQQKLKTILDKQSKLNNLLNTLNILKQDNIKKEKLAKLKEKQRLKRLKALKLKKQKLEKKRLAKLKEKEKNTTDKIQRDNIYF